MASVYSDAKSINEDLRYSVGVSDGLLAIGRIIFAVMFLLSGGEKFMDLDGIAQMIAGKGLPMPQLLAIATATLELGGGLLIILGWQTRIAALALAVFTVVAAYFFHDFWNLPHGAERVAQMVHAMKNLSIVGGFIMLAAVGAGRYSLDGPCAVHPRTDTSRHA
jgi:putative oxidoreductase